MLDCTPKCAQTMTRHMQVLCIHLLHEAAQGVTSSWQHYIAQLPTDYTLLINFRKRHVKALQLPHAQSIAQAASDQAQEQWSGAHTLLQALGKPGCLHGTAAEYLQEDSALMPIRLS